MTTSRTLPYRLALPASTPLRLSSFRRSPVRLGALPMAVMAVVSAAATAQAAAPGETIVVTASGAQVRVFDAPFAVGVVDAAELRSAGPMVNLSEALARVPGLAVSNRSNYAQDLQISSRGFGARASFGVRGLRLYADGIPASGPDGQGQVSNFDLAGAERIEVLRGPFSALYGNSSGGVISLISAAPKARGVSIALDGGSDGLHQWRLGVESPFEGGFSVRAQVSKFEIDGFRPQSRAERTLGNVRLGWDGAQDRVVIVLNSINQPALDPLGLTRAQFQQNPDQTTGVALPQSQPGQGFRYNTRKNTWQDQAGASWRHRFAGEGALRESLLAVYGGQRSVTQWQAIPDTAQAPATQPGGVIDFDRSYRGADARLVWRWALAGERQLQLVTGASVRRARQPGRPPARQAAGRQRGRSAAGRAVSHDPASSVAVARPSTQVAVLAPPPDRRNCADPLQGQLTTRGAGDDETMAQCSPPAKAIDVTSAQASPVQLARYAAPSITAFSACTAAPAGRQFPALARSRVMPKSCANWRDGPPTKLS
jgi:iron complex outermembrane receptor protein